MTPSAGRADSGKEIAFDAGASAPRSEGPSRMPDSTSPITGGWPIARPPTAEHAAADDHHRQGEQDVEQQLSGHEAASPSGASCCRSRSSRTRSVSRTARLNQSSRDGRDDHVDADEGRKDDVAIVALDVGECRSAEPRRRSAPRRSRRACAATRGCVSACGARDGCTSVSSGGLARPAASKTSKRIDGAGPRPPRRTLAPRPANRRPRRSPFRVRVGAAVRITRDSCCPRSLANARTAPA